MAFLSMMVFYLPAECSEKITLGISILLALVVFLLLVSKILPPTSDTIPLMAKYLLLTFILNIVAIVVTVVIINVYFRSATTSTMSNTVRVIFLEFLPRCLMMKRPERIPIFNGYFVEEYCVEEIFDASLIMPSITATILPFTEVGRRRRPLVGNHHKNCKARQTGGKGRTFSLMRKMPSQAEESVDRKKIREAAEDLLSGKYSFGPRMTAESCSQNENDEFGHEQRMSQDLQTTVESIAFIAEHMKCEMSDKKVIILVTVAISMVIIGSR